MSVKFVVAAAVFTMSLSAGQAFAENEGGGDPFAFRTEGQTTMARMFVADVGSAGYPHPTGNVTASHRLQGFEPANGSEASIQTDNSLPRRFARGTVAYNQAQALNRYQAVQVSQGRYRDAGTARP